MLWTNGLKGLRIGLDCSSLCQWQGSNTGADGRLSAGNLSLSPRQRSNDCRRRRLLRSNITILLNLKRSVLRGADVDVDADADDIDSDDAGMRKKKGKKIAKEVN